MAALASVAGLCAAGLVLSTSRNRLSPALALPAILLGCLLLWGTASALWSVDPIRTLAVAARLAGLFAAGLALVSAASLIAAPRRMTLFLVGGLAVALTMAAAERATDGVLSSLFSDRTYRTSRLNQASISFAILLFPVSAMLVCRGQKIFAVLLATATAVTVFGLAGTAAKAVLIAGLPMGLLLYRSRPLIARAAAAISIVVIVRAIDLRPASVLPALSGPWMVEVLGGAPALDLVFRRRSDCRACARRLGLDSSRASRRRRPDRVR
jgi:hypothetical protein